MCFTVEVTSPDEQVIATSATDLCVRDGGRQRGRGVGSRRGAVLVVAGADLLQRHVLGRVHYLGAGAGGGDERARVGGGRLHLAVLLEVGAARRRRRRRRRADCRVADGNITLC